MTKEIHSTKSTKSTNAQLITVAAQKALDLISEAQTALPLENGPVLKARKSALGLQHVSAEAISESASILEANPDRFPTFSATLARDSVAYSQAASAVVNRATSLIAKVQASALQHHAAAAEQAVAVFAVLKGHARTDGSAVADMKRLSPLLNTRKNPHQTKAQREKAKAKSASVVSPAPSADASATAASMTHATPAVSPAVAAPSANTATPVAPLTNGASAPAGLHS